SVQGRTSSAESSMAMAMTVKP
ncbi:MAG: hypothetical protein QOG30_192, partial [Acidimicrobiaceae bacterium]